jgi:FtsP/CotA-like multicopper oxidase with cupredoxin domain
MYRIKKLITLLALAGLLSVLAFAPVTASPVQAAGGTIIYNLYATDAYIPLADGSAVYNYGFVGGRQGVPLFYQKSVTPSDTRDNGDGGTGLPTSYTYNGNGTIPTGAPAPTGGPVQPAEQKLQGNAQFPAPLIYAAVGDVVEIRLKNLGTTVDGAPNDPHSIHLHGLDVDAANDGVPETSVGAIPANLCADGTTSSNCSDHQGPQPGAGNVVVYMFSPKFPGTTMWHCHQEADIHVQMGMYGALVIYNRGDAAATTGPGSGKGGTLYGWKYDKDYVLLESELGPAQHVSEELGGNIGYNPVDYHPNYWFLNGLSFPNTIHVGLPGAGWSDWIAAHPGYDPFLTGSISKKSAAGTKGERVLIRMINMGYETQPMHMHGYHGKVIGSDQRGWYWANTPGLTPFGLGLEKNTLTIGSGETYDWLVDFGQQSLAATYPAGTQTRYGPATSLPKSNTQTGLPAIPDLTSDAVPYIGGPTVTGAQGIATPGQLFPFHNHDDYKATNNGTYPGGMFTVLMPLP